MAEEKKAEQPQFTYEQLINVDDELAKRKQLVDIALTKIDQTWTVHDTKDEKISVAYKQIGDSNAYTTRGVMRMKEDIEFYWKYAECGYDDVYIDAMKTEDKTTENRIVKLVDDDHQIVYASNLSGFYVVSDRDFTYVRTRFKLTNYTHNNTKYKKIVATLSYSVADNHPLNVPTKAKHVRAKVIMTGNVLSQKENDPDDEFEACYILAMDPCGWIPTWVVNQFAPSKGMDVKKFVNNWGKFRKMWKGREANNFQKDHVPLFKVHPKLAFVEDEKDKKPEEENTDDNKDDQ